MQTESSLARQEPLESLQPQQSEPRLHIDIVVRGGAAAGSDVTVAIQAARGTRLGDIWTDVLTEAEVEEIWINEPTKVFVARHGVHELTTTVLTADEVRDLVEKMLKSSGRRVDLSTPFVDAMLPDGSRLHVAIPDITRVHWSVTVSYTHLTLPTICSV